MIYLCQLMSIYSIAIQNNVENNMKIKYFKYTFYFAPKITLYLKFMRLLESMQVMRYFSTLLI